MSIYYCQSCQQYRDNNYIPMTETEICEPCLEEIESSLPDESEVDLTPRNDGDYISKKQVRRFAASLGISMLVSCGGQVVINEPIDTFLDRMEAR
jgi:hypothetical protein